VNAGSELSRYSVSKRMATLAAVPGSPFPSGGNDPVSGGPSMECIDRRQSERRLPAPPVPPSFPINLPCVSGRTGPSFPLAQPPTTPHGGVAKYGKRCLPELHPRRLIPAGTNLSILALTFLASPHSTFALDGDGELAPNCLRLALPASEFAATTHAFPLRSLG